MKSVMTSKITNSTCNYVEQTFTSLQVDKTLPEVQQLTPIWKAVQNAHNAFSLLYVRLNSVRTIYKDWNMESTRVYTTLWLS